MLDGIEKYGRGDWKKGMPQDVIIDSLMRHLQALKDGEIVVPDSKHGATHWDSIVTNALMLSELRPAAIIDATSDSDLDEHGGKVWGDGVYRINGFDAEGYNISGFDTEGWHRTHDFNNPCCNCPSCR